MRTLSFVALALLSGSGLALAQAPSTALDPLANPSPPQDARVFIVSPADGATVGQDVTVKFGSDGIAIEPAGMPRPGSGHHHLLIDTEALPPLGAPIPSDARHKHYGKGQIQDTIHLQPGTHTLQLLLGNGLHMQFDPPLASKRITIHVK